jgi:hypothetical protein
MTLNPIDSKNKLQQILSPNPDDDGVWIHQDAWFHLGSFDKNFETTYTVKKEGNGVYFFVINGSFTVNDQTLNTRDGLGIWDVNQFEIKSNSEESKVLIMEVPMKF